jgi:hypothetical protein
MARGLSSPREITVALDKWVIVDQADVTWCWRIRS